MICRKLSFILIAFFCCLPSLSCSRKEDDGRTIIRVASVLPEDHPSSKALVFFKERLKELSGDTVDVKLFLNSKLGKDTEAIELCKSNNIEAVFMSVAPLLQYIPDLNALAMPFIFRDSEHFYNVVDGQVGQMFAEKLKSNNFHTMCYCYAGSRNIMTKQGPVNSPEDVKGMKIRVMGAPLMEDSINAIGASAISMSQGEVYTALQTGVIDGWENNPPTTLSFRMYETGCVYYAHTQHLMIPDLLLMSQSFYSQLVPEVKGWVDQVTDETRDKQRQLWEQSEEETIEKLKLAGMKFNQVDKELFRDCVKGVYDKYYEKYGREFKKVCEEIIATP